MKVTISTERKQIRITESTRYLYYVSIRCVKCGNEHKYHLPITLTDEKDYIDSGGMAEDLHDQKVREFLDRNPEKVTCWNCRYKRSYMKEYMRNYRKHVSYRIIKCEQCGKSFQAKRSDARYCSSSCRVKKSRSGASGFDRSIEKFE